MAEPRFNNPYFWPPPPTMPSQVRLSLPLPAFRIEAAILCLGLGCSLQREGPGVRPTHPNLAPPPSAAGQPGPD